MTIWRAYFSGDIHGSEVCFRKFLRAAKFYDVSTLILAGDLVGKGAVPIVRGKGNYRAEYGGQTYTMGTDQEMQAFGAMIDDVGLYSFVTSEDDFEALCGDAECRDKRTEELICERINRWLSSLEEASAKAGWTFYVSPGNDDPLFIDAIIGSHPGVRDPEGKIVMIHDQIAMLTYGYTNPSPWNTERELAEEELYNRLDGLAAQATSPHRTVFLLHAPPHGMKIDMAPALTDNLQIKGGIGGTPMRHVGSTAVRRIVEKYQPLVAVHGHIHKSAGVVKIGNTKCFNPGSEYAQGILRGLLLNFEVGSRVGLLSHLAVSG